MTETDRLNAALAIAATMASIVGGDPTAPHYIRTSIGYLLTVLQDAPNMAEPTHEQAGKAGG